MDISKVSLDVDEISISSNPVNVFYF